ncbi:hypothetical protein [Lentzea californiensis]|uniref:hypothetical protein n=1 Tax=Lentzea californiensis TaxID=438851 RepID=UPI0021665392|nr:hypothetical protein [Lentzea californiensis]
MSSASDLRQRPEWLVGRLVLPPAGEIAYSAARRGSRRSRAPERVFASGRPASLARPG